MTVGLVKKSQLSNAVSIIIQHEGGVMNFKICEPNAIYNSTRGVTL